MKQALTLIGQDGFILWSIKIYLVGDLVKGGRSTILIVGENLKGEFQRTDKRVLHPHARTDRSMPQTAFWFSYGGRDYTVYDLPSKIEQAKKELEKNEARKIA